MDLYFGDGEPTDEERAAVDALLGPPGSFWEGGERRAEDLRWSRGGRTARELRHLLLPGLHALNDRVGRISPGGLAHLCRRLSVPPAEAYGVATFHPYFSVRPRPRTVLRICADPVCAAAGADALRAGVESRLTPADGVAVERSSCLGHCDRAPAARATRAGDPARSALTAPATPATALLSATSPDSLPDPPPPAASTPQMSEEDDVPGAEPVSPGVGRVLLRRVGVVDPGSVDDYRAHGGFVALRRALSLGVSGALDVVAAVWPQARDVAGRPERPHHVVCDADAWAAGDVADRVLLEGDPYALVEAMTIAGYTTGARRGFVVVGPDHPDALRRLDHAVSRARARGLLGEDVLGRGHVFDIEVRRGAGGRTGGEHSAVHRAVEGHRAEPLLTGGRGLFGRPTLTGRVETFVGLLPLLTPDAPAYAARAPRLFSVSGCVDRPGLYELPSGTPLRDLLDLAGVRQGLRAVLLGGPAGRFVRADPTGGADRLGVPLTPDTSVPGSGAVLTLDATVDLPRLLSAVAGTVRAASCGQCVPCRIGTVRQEEALHRLASRTGTDPADTAAATDDVALLRAVGRALRDASACGVGRGAWNAVESALDELGVYA
ncbi:NAD(P)H-dependent oxidoreductase subunit E [Streptomyces sp. NPDC026672]|uniref:NAD(P)H-dependent oxidoreductase subunit E n=1 Tax=unclassified Streptomyces TaxID=2593676 RepID=UPI00340E9243